MAALETASSHSELAETTSGGVRPGRLPGWLTALFVLAVIAAGAAYKAPEFFLPMGEDQGIFNYAGQLMLHGGSLYRDFWETKPPGEYALRAVLLAPFQGVNLWTKCWVGQAYNPCGVFYLQAVDLVYSILTAFAVFAVARAFLRPAFAWAAAILAIIHVNNVMVSQEGNVPEKHALLPITLAIWAYQRALATHRDRFLVLAGFLVGLAFLFKQPAAMIGVALAADALVRAVRSRDADRWTRAVRAWGGLALGLAGVLLPLFGYLAAAGLLRDFWEQVVVFNLGKAATAHGGPFDTNLLVAWQVFRDSSGLLWSLGVLGLLLGLVAPRERRLPLVWALWAIASVAAVAFGGAKLAQTYFLYLVPAFAVVGAYALQHLADLGDRWLPRPLLTRLGLVALCLLGLGLTSRFERGVMLRIRDERFPVRTTETPEERLAYNASFLPRGGSLYIWGGSTELYVLTNSHAPTRHTHVFFLSQVHSNDPSYLDRRAELMRDLRRTPPAVILVSPKTHRDDPDGSLGMNLSSFPELERFLDERYQRVFTQDGYIRYDLVS